MNISKKNYILLLVSVYEIISPTTPTITVLNCCITKPMLLFNNLHRICMIVCTLFSLRIDCLSKTCPSP